MNFDELNSKLSVFLDDAQDSKGEYQFALPLRCDGWNFAQDAFAEHTLAEKTAQLKVEPDGYTAILPSDFVQVGMIYDESWTYTQRRFTPGASRTVQDNSYTYWIWAGQLHFEVSVSSAVLTLDYFAHWPHLKWSTNEANETAISGNIEVPDWALLPLIHLTAAYCLQPYAIRAAMTRNSNITIDSGNPEHNSRKIQAREHLWWYDALMAKHSPQVRVFAYGDN
jgi:hypothetical protein